MASRYLLHFAHEHISFRWPEFLAIASKNNCSFDLISSAEHLETRPYILIELNDESQEECLINCAREGYMLKDLYELWAQSSESIQDLAVAASVSKRFLSDVSPHKQSNQTFRISYESFNNKVSQSSKVAMMKEMFFVNQFEARLNLSKPSLHYVIFEMNEREKACGPILSKEYYFCRHLTSGSRTLVDKFALKNRVFIANTTMDPMMSFVAANMAMIRHGDLVYDPFVGSGGLLVSAAHKGAFVLGADIDWMLLHGKSKPTRHTDKKRRDEEGVRANLKQYDLENQYIDVMVSDISRQPLREDFQVDSIITDPPYGIRESSEKIGCRRDRQVSKGPAPADRVRYPSKVVCDMSDLLRDLLIFSTTHLRPGGRLVYYLPVTFSNDKQRFEDFIPSHPSLRLIAYSSQPMTKKSYRLMVTMEKLVKQEEPEISASEIGLPQSLCEMNIRNAYFPGNLN